jgi:hypothetical protein
MDYSKYFGWIQNEKEVENVISRAKLPFMSTTKQNICGTGEGKTVLLYKVVEQVTGRPFEVLKQAIGDCVSFSLAQCINCLTACEILMNKESEIFPGLNATEYIYAISRVYIGRGQLGNEDGSVGAWSVEGAAKYGTLLKTKYPTVDLSIYSGQRAKEWGRSGPPKELIPLGQEHLVKTYSIISTYEEARDAIANGFPITVCSNQGFSDKRDKDGFAKPEGNWGHALAAIGVIDNQKRSGILICNSWANWNSGPKFENQPDGSFFVDRDIFENKMLRAGDSWAISNFQGYPKQDIDWHIAARVRDKLKDFEGVEK